MQSGSCTGGREKRTGATATLYEWDEDIPEFAVVHAESAKTPRLPSARSRNPGPWRLSWRCNKFSAGCRMSSSTQAPRKDTLAAAQTAQRTAGAAGELIRPPAT